MASERVFESRSAEATERLGCELGSALDAGAVVALHGELGAGKTCLVRGLARGLGVTQRVSSPTFTLLHQYDGRLPLYHFDAWMEGRERAFLEGGGAEWLSGTGVAVVEWAARVADWLPLPRLEVFLEHLGPEERLIRLVREPGGGSTEDPPPTCGDPGGLLSALERVPRAGAPDLEERP